MGEKSIEKAYQEAKERFAELEVDTDAALAKLKAVALSIQCWQGDDVSGFENPDADLSGGIQVTGNYPGKPRNITEFRQDVAKMFSLVPGTHRLNLHSIYGEFTDSRKDRDEISEDNFKGWVSWAQEQNIKLDFNCTCFAHPKADSGYTLSSKDKEIRDFWIRHTRQARRISAFMGKELNSPCVHNIWVPDGSKDYPVDRMGHRAILKESLDEILSESFPKEHLLDAVESKLFGIGAEAFTSGSHEFYLLYSLYKGIMPTLDTGHFHPTESVADKISAVLQFHPELLLHVSRPMRWDSDHIVVLNDDIRYLCQELVRSGCLQNIHIGLDFFDATLNRIGAWVIGSRATLKGLLRALLEPHQKLLAYEEDNNFFARLALLEEVKGLPWGSVWDYFCKVNNNFTDREMFTEILDHEKKIISQRD